MTTFQTALLIVIIMSISLLGAKVYSVLNNINSKPAIESLKNGGDALKGAGDSLRLVSIALFILAAFFAFQVWNMRRTTRSWKEIDTAQQGRTLRLLTTITNIIKGRNQLPVKKKPTLRKKRAKPSKAKLKQENVQHS